jgi:hypothetical protein
MKQSIKTQTALPPCASATHAAAVSPAGSQNSQQQQCVYGIPLIVKIPRRGEMCAILNKGRAYFQRRIRKWIFIPLPSPGSKKGSGEVFGPSVCDAKFGCVCALRARLEELRKNRCRGRL